MNTQALFKPFTLRNLTLPNRIAMAPMTRSRSPLGIPNEEVVAYYRRRAEGGVGLIISEGTYVPDPAAGFDANVPRFYGEASLAGWKRVIDAVHAAGGIMFPQLWHVGAMHGYGPEPAAGVRPVSPSGLKAPGEPCGVALTVDQIHGIVKAFGDSAAFAKELGFDGVEIHGAHGYLIDQFFWSGTNLRTDEYGGDMAGRGRFAVEVIEEIRRRVGPDYPVAFRFSQWKQQDFSVKLGESPDELGRFLDPLSRAGVDLFHCSTRRFWEPEFPDSNLNLAGWTKQLTGKPTVTVGSVSLNGEFMKSFQSDETAGITGLEELLERLERGEFDLVAVGRALLVNPAWPALVRAGDMASLNPFNRSALAELI